jgi:hypothetical protein
MSGNSSTLNEQEKCQQKSTNTATNSSLLQIEKEKEKTEEGERGKKRKGN